MIPGAEVVSVSFVPRSETIRIDSIVLKCTIMTIYDRCCHVCQFFEANGTCTSVSWITLEIPSKSYMLQRNVTIDIFYDTIWYIVHKQLAAIHRLEEKTFLLR